MAPFLFTDAILNGRKIKVFNNGEMSRDFTFIDDISNSIYSAYDTSPGATVEEIVIRPQLGDI